MNPMDDNFQTAREVNEFKFTRIVWHFNTNSRIFIDESNDVQKKTSYN